jgi:hypothetical protein
MTRKDYIEAAKLLRDSYPPGCLGDARHDAAMVFAAFFAADNPRFDRQRFLDAVNGEAPTRETVRKGPPGGRSIMGCG